jgi:hypothetical protein
VRDAARQLTQSLKLLRLDQRRSRFFELLLGLLALSDIARDLGEADMLAALVEDGIEHDAGPEK